MLLRQIEIFLRETGMAWTRFGRLAVRDPRLVQDMRNGRQPGPHTEQRVNSFMRDYRQQNPEQLHVA